MNIIFEKNPNSSDVAIITSGLNEETSQYKEAYPFAFFIKNENKEIIGGANGFVIFEAIYTEQLWIKKEYRSHGYGTKIMDKIHEHGKNESCKIATLQTMTFLNTQNFYEKLGYKADYIRKGYVDGSSCIFMKKDL